MDWGAFWRPFFVRAERGPGTTATHMAVVHYFSIFASLSSPFVP